MKMLVILLALVSTAGGQVPSASALAHKIDEHYNHLRSLTAHFSERYQGMGIDRTESGTLTLRKPGRMRWAYDSGSSATPSGKLFILDGKSAISYTPGDAQAQRTPAKQLDDLRSPLRFLLGHTELARELDNLTLTLVSDVPRSYTLSGTPKGMQQTIRTIALTVGATGEIQTMRVEQTDGAITSFNFTAIRENIATSDGDFTFIPPPGVTITNGTAPI
jgi:outer membrane lipoprotein carrier protein